MLGYSQLKPVLTEKMFTIRAKYFLQDCRPIKDQFQEYKETLLQKGYSLLIDPVTLMALIVSQERGQEPLSMYRFGATVMKDSPFVREMISSSGEGLIELIEGNKTQLKKDILGTVIMELDTMSTRLLSYRAKTGKKGLLLPAIYPDKGDDKLMDCFPDGTKFIQGVKGVYYPGLAAYLKNTDLHFYHTDGKRPDKGIGFRGNNAQGAHDSVDSKIREIHDVDVRYLLLPVGKEISASAIRQMSEALFDTGFADDDVFSEAKKARERGEVVILRDLDFTLSDLGLI